MKQLMFAVIFQLIVIATNAQRLSLAGQWQVQLGSLSTNSYAMQLPGTLDDAGIGDSLHVKPSLTIEALAHLSRKVQYVGKAYYSRYFTVPTNWKSGVFLLNLGRVLWRSSVMIDGNLVPATGESLVSSHQFDLTAYLRPGQRHKITICIDNSNIYPGINIYATQYPSKESSEMTHAYTNHTQIKWNGILGEISIIRKEPVYVDQVIIAPDQKNRQLNIRYTINNAANDVYSISSFVIDPAKKSKWSASVKSIGIAEEHPEVQLAIPADARNWDEFSPALYRLTTIVKSASGSDTLITSFGIRSLAVKEADLLLNDYPLFIRGNLECIIFPLTGYPPMKLNEWKKLFTTAKQFGLNSFRFHSWCPPEAAFAAADEIGFYLQVELPHWNLKVGTDTASFNFLRKEAYTILAQYGNHPSFMFFSMGNELEGDFGKLNKLVTELKTCDGRRLYSTTTFTFQKEFTGAPQSADDFYVTQWTKKGWVRGQGIFNDKAPDFTSDFSPAMGDLEVPLISHEIGQYSVYPDLTEIKDYTGNLQPVNMIAVRNDLQAKGMSYLAPKYLNASGKLAALLYKAEIEMALKTKGMDGFQLLQLQDFPGQGTALVGLVNAFWKNKGFITPDWFHRFCSEVTPLIRFKKAVYSNREEFSASVELANFYRTLRYQSVYWRIMNGSSNILGSGNFPRADYTVGNGIQVGAIRFPLSKITKATQLTIEVGVAGTDYRNEWNIWVYPDEPISLNPDILITADIDEAMTALDNGRKVLLCAHPDSFNGVPGKFVPVFWSPVHFPDQPGTMGLLIKKDHAAFRDFPTDVHTDWQWWDLVTKSKSLVVKDIPEQAIIIRVIDNFVRNQQLSVLFEGKLGKGKILVCSIDLNSDVDKRISARQLKQSLIHYMGSKEFAPEIQLKNETIRNFFK